MRVVTRLTTAVVLLTLAAATADAQERPRHRGFWFGMGFGGGWNSWQWSLGTAGMRGAAAYIRMGGTPNRHVLFGGEALVWWREDGSVDLERVNATATALIYPGSNGGLFFKGGFGIASSEIESVDREGVGTTLGLGYDFRLGGNFYVTPNVDLLVQFFENSTNASLLFTFGTTWH